MDYLVGPVCDDHVFKDERLFFRFRKDDGTYEEPPNTALLARGEQIYKRLLSGFSLLAGRTTSLIMIAQDTQRVNLDEHNSTDL